MAQLRFAVPLVLFASVTLVLPAAAQTSGIAGTVRDATGAVLPGVTVEASSPALIEKVRSVVSDEQGQYRVLALVPGTYTVSFSLPGFTGLQRENIQLSANFTATINVEMVVGSLAETVTVSGQSPVVDVQNTATRNLITREVLEAVPTNRTLAAWAALTPGLSAGATAMDVGGSKGEQSIRLAIHGGRGSEQRMLLDGMNVSGVSSYWGFMPDPASTEEVVIALGGGSAEADLGGVQMNFIPKDGGNRFSGYFFTNYANRSFQADNLSETIRRRGLTTVNAVDHIYDADGSFGGPLKVDHLWFFSAHRRWGNGTQVAGLFFNQTPTSFAYTPDRSRPGIEDYRQQSHNLRLTWVPADRHKVRASFDFQSHCDCHRGIADGRTSPEAAHRRIYRPNNVPQAAWSFPATNRLLLEAGVSARIFNWVNTPAEPDVTTQSITVLEQSNNFRYRAAQNYGEHLSSGADQRFAVSYITGTHAIKTGIQTHQTWVRHEDMPGSAMQYTFRDGSPVSVTQFANPFVFNEKQNALLGAFVQDQWTMKRLTVNYGLRYDYVHTYVPEQRFGAGPFVPAREFANVPCVPCWHDFSPRFGVAYNLFGDGRTAVKFGLNRYMAEQTNEIARANNPVTTTVNSATRAWTDVNRDFIPQPSELGPLSNVNFGNVVVTSRYADDLLRGTGARAYNWQWNASVQHELMSGVGVNVGYFRTTWHNFYATNNLAVTPRDFDPFCITLPVDARLPNGGGNQVCGFTDVTPSKFGQVNSLVTRASEFGERLSIFNGIDATVSARLPRGAFIGGGLSTGRQLDDSCFIVDRPLGPATPAGQLASSEFCRVRSPFWRPQIKVNGSYPLTWDMQVSAVWQTLPGIPILASYVATRADIAPSLGRNLAGNVLNATLEHVIAPQTLFEGGIHQMDVRVTKSVRLGGLRMQGMLDLYNIFNASPVLAINTRYGPSWLAPTQILSGRMFKLGGKVEF
jgi:hypothetical protein